MLILSNGFPTNMPNAEKVSQGGPANFAKLFVNYIVSNTNHCWIGVMLEGVVGETTRLKQVFSSKQRKYFRLRVPRSALKTIVRSQKRVSAPDLILKRPIDRLIKLIKQKKPDVVFLNGFGLFNWMLLMAAEKTGTPVAIQHAGIWTKELTIHKKLYSPQGKKTMEQMEKDSTRLASAEIFLNDWSKNYYQDNVAKGRREKISTIPLPFDFKSFKLLGTQKKSTLFNFDKKHLHVGIIARWDEIKNHQAVLTMAKMAQQKKLPWFFHSVVDIPNLKKYESGKAEYEKYVDVVLPLDRAGISDFCRSVDMLMLPSLFDVSPTVVLEAMASSTPIVISPTIGYVHDFSLYGGKDWIINFENPERAIKKLSRLIDKKMPGRLKKHLTDIHDHGKVFATYLKTFAKIINSKPSGYSGHVNNLKVGGLVSVGIPG